MTRRSRQRAIQRITQSAAETAAAGARLAAEVEPGDVILLDGNLGAGKTTFVQGFCRALHVADGIQSPTFVLAQSVPARRGRRKLWVHHLDFYRMTTKKFFEMGIHDYFSSFGEIPPGVVLVEWASKFPKAVPRDHLAVRIKINRDRSRTIRFSGNSRRVRRLLKPFRSRA